MKNFLAICIVALGIGYFVHALHQQNFTTADVAAAVKEEVVKKPAHDPDPTSAPAAEPAKQTGPHYSTLRFSGKVLQVIDGGVLANGWIQGESKYHGDLIITGIGQGLYENASWSGLVDAAGTQTFITPLDTSRTLPAFHHDPNAISAQTPAAQPSAAPTQPGSWMRDNQRTALDQPAR